MDINLKLQSLKENILNQLATSNLPPSMVYYGMKDIMRMVQRDYENYINMALQKQQEEKQQQENNEDQEE